MQPNARSFSRFSLSSFEAQVQKPKRVHCHPKHGARIEGLTMPGAQLRKQRKVALRSVVSSAEEVMELLHFGNQMRTVAATRFIKLKQLIGLTV